MATGAIVSLLKRGILLLVVGGGIFTSPSAHAALEPLRVLLVNVNKGAHRGSVSQVRAALERALERTESVSLVPRETYSRVLSDQGIPRRDRLNQAVLAQMGDKLALDAIVTAQLYRRDRSYHLALEIVWAPEKPPSWRGSIELRGPRLSNATAQIAIEPMVEELTQQKHARATAAARKHEQAPAAEPKPDLSPPTGVKESSAWAIAQEDWGPTSSASSAPSAKRNRGSEGATPVQEGAAGASFLASGVPVQWGGEVAAEHITYFESVGNERVDSRNEVLLALEAQARVSVVHARGRILARRDFSNTLRDRIDAEEVALGVASNGLTVEAGRLMVAWGSASLIHPSDAINVFDRRDLLNTERYATWMVRAGAVVGPLKLEGYYLPVPEADLIPFPTGISPDGTLLGPWRWIPTQPLALPTTELPLVIAAQGPPAPALSTVQGAARLALTLPGVDLSLGYIWRYDPLPTIQMAPSPPPPAAPEAITVQLTHQRVHLITADLEFTLGKLRVAAEGRVTLSSDLDAKDPEIVDPYVSVAAGGDYRSSSFWGNCRVHLFGEMLLHRALVGQLSDDLMAQIRYPLPTAALVRIRQEVGEDLRVDLNVITALDRFDLLLWPAIELVVEDRLTLGVSLAIPLGDKDEGLFGPFHKNARVAARASYEF